MERKDVWYSHYRLSSKGTLNSITTRRDFEGLLIKVGDGYGCIHPWPELGDPSLEKCLEDLRGRRFWPIVRRALRCAEYDEAARLAWDSLFDEMEVPRSHATLVGTDIKDLSLAIEAGFEIMKLKVGKNLNVERRFLQDMVMEHPSLRWRLDFNESLHPSDLEVFLDNLSENVRRAIEFLEDPCPFSEEIWERLWRKYRIPLAVDRESGPHRKAAQYCVIKPAVDEPFLLGEGALMNQQRVVMTSYMDHPLGQAFAAWEAARLELMFPGLVTVCGLQTHHLFESNQFVERMGEWRPEFQIPTGTGLGFDDELAALNWVKL